MRVLLSAAVPSSVNHTARRPERAADTIKAVDERGLCADLIAYPDDLIRGRNTTKSAPAASATGAATKFDLLCSRLTWRPAEHTLSARSMMKRRVPSLMRRVGSESPSKMTSPIGELDDAAPGDQRLCQ